MAITIVATVGSASANSFVTEAEQIAFMATRLNAPNWASVSGSTCTDSEKKAMVEASRLLSARAWKGVRTDTTQVLAWPRQLVHDPDSPNNDFYASSAIPQRVKNATCELAAQFMESGTTDIATLDATVGIVRKKTDVLETEYAPHMKAVGLSRFPRVMEQIAPLLAANRAGFAIVRG